MELILSQSETTLEQLGAMITELEGLNTHTVELNYKDSNVILNLVKNEPE